MLRSFIPFLLVSLGFSMILWTDRRPLFEWQVSGIVTDFSLPCEFTLPSSPWITRLGESLDLKGRPHPLTNLNVVIRRSQTTDVLDQVSRVLYRGAPWLFVWSLFEVILSIVYMWQFLLQDKQAGVFRAIFLTRFFNSVCRWILLLF